MPHKKKELHPEMVAIQKTLKKISVQILTKCGKLTSLDIMQLAKARMAHERIINKLLLKQED